MPTAHASALEALTHLLAQLRSDGLTVSAFSAQARGQTALLAALPARYGEVWLDLLDRLESSALFSEESCSFSQTDLLDNLGLVLDKAEQQLTHTP